MFKTSLLIFSLISISLPLFAEPDFAEPISTIENMPDFAVIYHKQCATCHGNNGDGQGRAGASLIPAPTNFVSSKLSLDKIKNAIKNGIAGTSMTAYGSRFNEVMLNGLASYIQQEFMLEKTTALSASSEEKAQGRALYVQHCSACHGDNGNTAVWARNALNPAPRNFTSPQAKAELSLERMINSVTYGRPGTAMMPFEKRLNSDQIKSVVGFIRSSFMGAFRGAEGQALSNHAPETLQAPTSATQIAIDPVNMNLPFPKNLVGDAVAGEKFFQENCFTCHGEKGDGKGPRSHFNIPKPRDFTSSESRRTLNRPRLFKGISHGKPRTVMPAWSTVLSDQKIADIAEYVFQSFVLGQFVSDQKEQMQKKKR